MHRKTIALGLGGIAATLVAGGIAFAAIQDGNGLGPADANADGTITRAEWLKKAEDHFVRLDANKDGKLAAAELPRRFHGGRGGRHGHHGWRDRGGDGDWSPPPPPGATPLPPPPPPAASPSPAGK